MFRSLGATATHGTQVQFYTYPFRSALSSLAGVIGVVLELAVIQQWHTMPGSNPRWIYAGAALIVFNTLLRIKLAFVRCWAPSSTQLD